MVSAQSAQSVTSISEFHEKLFFELQHQLVNLLQMIENV